MFNIFKKKKVNSKNKQLTRDEIYDTFNKISAIYEENANIISSFCKRTYLEKGLSKVWQYKLSYDNRFSPLIIVCSPQSSVSYLLDKTVKIFGSKSILRDVFNFGTYEEKRACHCLNDLIPLIKSYEVIYNHSESVIKLAVDYHCEDREMWVEHTPFEAAWCNDRYRYYIEDDKIVMKDSGKLDKIQGNPYVEFTDIKDYQRMLQVIDQYKVSENKNLDGFLFASDNTVLDKYKNRSLENYDLCDVDFDSKNISGLDISHNLEAHINFDKLAKDLIGTNINGYDLKKYKFVGWNLTDTDLRNTKASVDLATCIISQEGKMSSGTLFDEENQFFFFEKPLNIKEVKDFGIKIYEKTK